MYRKRQFLLYDNIDLKNKPIKFGPQPFIIYEEWILNATKDLPTDQVLDAMITRIEKESDPSAPVILDIEHWNVHFSKVDRDKLLYVMRRIKSAIPNRIFGNYAITPWRHPDATLSQEGGALWNTWIAGNNAVSSIADESDALFPSLYTLNTSTYEWERFAVTMIKEARRYGGNKKVIPFLWPMYHDSMKEYSNTFLDEHFWHHQLMTCYRIADGVILWHNWTFPKQTWDSTLPFVKPTLKFIQRYVKV